MEEKLDETSAVRFAKEKLIPAVSRARQAGTYALNRVRKGWRYEPVWTKWVYQTGLSINEHLPERLKGRFEMQLEPGDTTAFPREKVEGKGLLIAPNNWAGQAAHWARAASTLPGVSAFNVQFETRSHLKYPADATVKKDVAQRSVLWSWGLNKWIDENISHVIVESGKPFLGNLFWHYAPEHTRELDGELGREIESLLERGKKVAFLWHGSDIRNPEKHMANESYSYFYRFPEDKRVVDQRKVEERAALADKLGLVEFVSTPGLLPYRPGATWLPQLYDTDRWKPSGDTVAQQRDVPKVLHVPSHPYLKGTKIIAEICKRLHDEGVIVYEQVSGVHPSRMPETIESADIVIDQLGDPNYGSAAIEAMAMGKVVLGQVGEDVPRVVEETFGLELPIVDINDDTLEDVLRGVAADRERRQQLAEDAAEYVRKVHNVDLVADMLDSHFLAD